jgi:hypothetical protein
MLKIIQPKAAHTDVSASRRDFLQTFGTVGALGLLTAGSSSVNAAVTRKASKGASLEALEKPDESHLLWQPTVDLTVQVLPPVFTVASGKQSQGPLPVTVLLAASRQEEDGVNFVYELSIKQGGSTRTGKYMVKYSYGTKDERSVLTQKSKLYFGEPLTLDLAVAHTVRLTGKMAVNCTLPLRYGVVRAFELEKDQAIAGYYALGKGSTAQKGEEIALPVIGLDFDPMVGGSLAVATDPYCGSQFRVWTTSDKAPNESFVTSSNTYVGSIVPLREEERTEVYVAHKGGINGTLMSFYDAVPEIHPSPSWIQEVQLTYYDDISAYRCEPGQGWYHDVEKLAEKIPTEHRGKVALCLECYYDYLGQYCYSHDKGQLAEAWDAYDLQAHIIPMSLAEVHKRIKYAKDRGFRVIWYFGDGMASDITSPYYRKDWVIKDESGKYIQHFFWQWRPELKNKMPPGALPVVDNDPSLTNHLLDPGNPEVVGWFLGYMEALLKEFGTELDGFTWDETELIKVGTISTTGSEPTYSDRAFMRLIGRLSQLLQEWRKVNPNLVFLAGDDGHTPYALVANGTYQDSGCSPAMWPLCLLINYRNCLWSCNWAPVREDNNNAFAVNRYGLAQGLSNGAGDCLGPAEMPEEILDCVIQRFLKRVVDGHDRTRYLQNIFDAMCFSAYQDWCDWKPPYPCSTS